MTTAHTSTESYLGRATQDHVARRAEEAQLIERLRVGCHSAFRELVETHGGRMLAAANGLLHNEEDAREVLQEAFLSAFKALASFDGRCALGTWLHRITVNAALMRMRAQQSRVYETVDELLPDFVGLGVFAGAQAEWSEGPGSGAERAELQGAVLAAIASLPESHRVPLLLRDIEGLSNADVAGELGVSVNAAKIRVHRARQALRTLLAPKLQGLA